MFLRSIRVFIASLNPFGYKNVDCLYPFHTKYKYIYARIEINIYIYIIYIMPSRRRTSKSTKKVRGGSAWQYAASVYGDSNAQQAVPGGGNLIATNIVSGGAENGAQNGGAVVATNGGNGFTQVAVPGVLLVANQLKNGRSPLFSRSNKFRRSRKSRKFRKSRR